MADTPDEIREAALRAVKWLKTSRAKAAPDAYNTILYLAARNHVLEERLARVALLAQGLDFTAQIPWVDKETDDPADQA